MKKSDALQAVIFTITRTEWSALQALHAIVGDLGFVGRVWYKGCWHSPLMLYQMPEMAYTPADECKVMFWGGPPEDRKYRHGTVMDFMLDCCFWMVHECDPELKLYHFLSFVADKNSDVRVGAP